MKGSLIATLAELVANGSREHKPELFRTVAARIRARLEPEDAEVVAEWFERMARGEEPIPDRGGRTRGAIEPRKPMPDGREPDDWDIAFIVHQNMKRRLSMKPRPKAGDVYKGVAKAFGMEPGTVRNIYTRCKSELPNL